MPLSPTQTRKILATLGHTPRKRLGQNFLVDPNIVRKSIQLAAVHPGDSILEIGPGLGTLSRALLDARATVYAVEVDPHLANHLRQSFQAEISQNQFILTEADAVKNPDGEMPAHLSPVKVVANLPYAISTPWMEKLLQRRLPDTLVLMLQKEAAERFLAEPGSKTFSPISILLQAAYQRQPGHAVSRQCFFPVPGVDSVLLHLQRRPQPHRLHPETLQIIRRIFTQRRKQIHSLTRQFPDTRQWMHEETESHTLAPTTRPESIALPAWIRLDLLIRRRIDSKEGF